MFAEGVKLMLKKIGFDLCLQEEPVTAYSFPAVVEQIITGLEIETHHFNCTVSVSQNTALVVVSWFARQNPRCARDHV